MDDLRRLGKELAELPPELVRAVVEVEGWRAGHHTGRRLGRSPHFSEHRPYTPGEPIQFLDWKVLARTDRPYVRRFASETESFAHLLLDRSGSMGYETKWEEGKLLSLALGYLFLRQGDRVFFHLMGAGLDPGEPVGTLAGLAAQAKRLRSVALEGEADFPAAVETLLTRFPRRGFLVVASDFLFSSPYGRELRLSAALHDVTALHLLHPHERELPRASGTYIDLETGRRVPVASSLSAQDFARRSQAWLAQVKQTTVDAGCFYVRHLIGRPIREALIAFMAARVAWRARRAL